MESVAASEQQEQPAPSPSEVSESRPPNAPTNDNSNPQQGSGSSKKQGMTASPSQPMQQGNQRQEFKIPPTKKDSRKLFVGGLPSDVTEHEFRTFFEQFGVVLDSVVMFDRETQRSRGFGFVTFVDPEVSRTLLTMGNHPDGVGRLVMRGKTCEVKAAQPKDGSNNNNRGGRGYRGGDRRDHQKYGQDGYMNAYPGAFQPPGAVNYAPPPPDVMAMQHFPYHPQAYHGYPVHPMYYPPGTQTTPPVHPSFIPTGAPINHLGPYVMGAEALQAPQASSGIPSGPPVPPNAQPQFVPMMNGPPQMAYPQSVMQPVAPGLPTKEEDEGAAEEKPN